MSKLLRHFCQLVLRREYRQEFFTLRQLRKIPRYTKTSASLLGVDFQIIDAASFIFQYKEIFKREIYKFPSRIPQPRIIDCGANIGLSVIYFKRLYPESRILAFEPDPQIFAVLEENIHQCGHTDIALVKKAVWTEDTTLEFLPDGSDGGRVVQLASEQKRIHVPTVPLSEYLNEPVDFLKIDIEGAETKVLLDCQDKLRNVQRLFVEYHSFIDAKQTLSSIMHALSHAGFRVYIHSHNVSRQPFESRKNISGMDMQLNIFASRE